MVTIKNGNENPILSPKSSKERSRSNILPSSTIQWMLGKKREFKVFLESEIAILILYLSPR
jgi:hypothetical protein